MIAISTKPSDILHIPEEPSTLLNNYAINHYIRTIVQVCKFLFIYFSPLLLPIYVMTILHQFYIKLCIQLYYLNYLDSKQQDKLLNFVHISTNQRHYTLAENQPCEKNGDKSLDRKH